VREVRHRVRQDDAPSLLEIVQAVVSGTLGRPLSRSEARTLVMAGAVRLDGRPVREPRRDVPRGGLIEARVRMELLHRRRPWAAPGARGRPPSVLYEDRALIAVDKPPGLPFHAGVDPGRPHLVGWVRSYLAARDGRPPDDVYLGIHQRLDRDTSGVALLARDEAVNRALARQFAGREVSKTYHALTVRPARLPPPSWTARVSLPDARQPRRRVPAETRFRLLEAWPRGLLVEACPSTGRKHQVRIHLAGAGMPVLGDLAHGGPPAARVMLHSLRLRLVHPRTREDLVIRSEYPADFARAAAALRGGGVRRSARRRR
jgi:23S rRNA-/tRNA-specific pseudouridylate synthase